MKTVKMTALIFATAIFGCTQKTENKIDGETGNPVFKTGYANVNGIRMYYEIHGEGAPLVLVHGGGSTIETSFGRILPVLARHRQVIAVELQAHGRTSDRDAPETFKQDADDVAGLLHELHITKADFLGFSNGGQTGIQFAISHPELLGKLILCSAFYKKDGVPEVFWKGMENAKFSDMPQPLKDGFLKINNNPKALLNMFNKDAGRMQHFNDWTDEDLKSIKAKTLIIIGDKDLMSTEHAATMSRLIPDAELAVLPGGHGKYLGEVTTLENGKWTQPYTADLISGFLDKQ